MHLCIKEINVNNVTDVILEKEAEISHVVDACVEGGEILQSTAHFIKHNVKEHNAARF